MVKKDKPGVPRPNEVYDLGNEPSYEDELRAYQSRFGILVGAQGEVEQSSTQPPPPQPSQEEDLVGPSTTLEDQVQDLTTQFDVYWDATQEHQVSINQDMDALRANINTVMRNQETILSNQQSIQEHLTQLLAFHMPPPLPPPPR